MSMNNINQGPTGTYSKVQKEVRLNNNKPIQILRRRQKPDWVDIYSSDEDIFAEEEPEEKIEKITEVNEETFNNLDINKKSQIENNSTHHIQYEKNLSTSEKNQVDFNEQEKELENKTNTNKQKRKIHISVVVEDKNKKNIENKLEDKKTEDIMNRKIFDKIDDDDDEIFKNLLNTNNLKLKVIEGENKKKIDEENRRKRQFEQKMIEKMNEEVQATNSDDDIFADAGNDVTIDINKKIIEKYTNKLKEKRLKENLEKLEENQKLVEEKNIKDDITEKSQVKSDNQENEEEEEEDVLFRPMFKEKESRVTIKELIDREKQEIHLKEMEEKLKTQKKLETKKLVIKYIKEDLNKKTVYDEEEKLEMPNDIDDPDDLDEYEQWKIRELKRIKKQAEEDEIKLKEKLEIERRRNLTDEQRKEENLRLGSDDTLRPFKSKLKFLQKYYHKGAFFSNERQENMDHVLNRDYNLPTWEDRIDKSNLPEILQKRRGLTFKKGQTKYTHLTNEDTTNFDPVFKIPDNIGNKISGMLGGVKTKNKFDIKYENKRSKNK